MKRGKDAHAASSHQTAAPPGAAEARASAAEGPCTSFPEARAIRHQATEGQGTEDERQDAEGGNDKRARWGAGRTPPCRGVRLSLACAGAGGVLPAPPHRLGARDVVAR